jgi:glycosyltransferase involved in cell wall biosynthesis
MSPPLVTIGVLSYNRLHYLRALMASARECVSYPRVQWIVVDGGSVEPGLREYVEGLEFLDHVSFEPCTQAEALNRIVELAEGDFLMLLPEDVQFIRRGPWLEDMVEIASRLEVGHVQFDAQRRVTLRRHFSERPLLVAGKRVPLIHARPRVLRASSGVRFLGYGDFRDPIGAAGHVTFTRTEIRRRLGPWRTNEARAHPRDSGLGAEQDMIDRFVRTGIELEAFLMTLPVVADVVTDPRGTKARIRQGNRRYGRYAPPPQGSSLYYRIRDAEELQELARRRPAPAFEDVVEPCGFELPLDEQGNLLKADVISPDEPYELVEGSA